jgi:SRSO17 transposase
MLFHVVIYLECGVDEPEELEQRFRQYLSLIVSALGHADREEPASMYLRGLILPGGRKSVEPMAARQSHDGEVTERTRQSLGHFVSNSPWKDELVLQKVARVVIPTIYQAGDVAYCIYDDSGHRKKGVKSVGVQRQYIGLLGKVDNCQVAVSISFATLLGSIPVGYQVYMPEDWMNDRGRCAEAGVPEYVIFKTKNQIALDLLDAATAGGMPPGIDLADAAYGDDADFRDGLTERGRVYAVAVREHTTVWWGKYQPAEPEAQTFGRPRTRLLRDSEHQPVAVSVLARELPQSSWEAVSWREGTNGTLSSRFARVRVRAANENKDRAEEWLLIEWPEGSQKVAHYYLSTLPESMSLEELVFHAKGRWRIERDYQELKSELGLSHFEGRGWIGFHHHATLCIAAYGFLVMERQRATKMPDLNMKDLPVPPPPAPGERGGRRQRHVPWSIPTLTRRLAASIVVELFSQEFGHELDGTLRDKIAEFVMNL